VEATLTSHFAEQYLLGRSVCTTACTVFSLWPLLAWIYESGFANFHQGLSPEQKLQNPTDAGFICTLRQFWVRMNGEPWPKAGGPGFPTSACKGSRPTRVTGGKLQMHAAPASHWKLANLAT